MADLDVLIWTVGNFIPAVSHRVTFLGKQYTKKQNNKKLRFVLGVSTFVEK